MAIDALILVAWLTPFLYSGLLLFGVVFNHRRNHRLTGYGQRKIEKVIYQIPTIGNYETTNRAIRIVKSYGLPVDVETWVIVEEDDRFKDRYEADRLVVVPRDFESEDLYKARALEYARRLRKKMVERGELTKNYILIQSDDDSYPSKEFILECLQLGADIAMGSIAPRPISAIGTIIDYERPVACNLFCNFFTNIGKPIWGHGEGVCISSDVDLNISYDVSDIIGRRDLKLALNEDLFYLHKAVAKGYTHIYNSEKPVFIAPPLSFRDAIKQRRRWLWGHIELFRSGMLPLQSRVRIILALALGLYVYSFSTLGIPLHYLGIIRIPDDLLILTWATLVLWWITRGIAIGKLMGLKHAIIGMIVSHITVTLDFILHIASLAKGNPRRFEVIRKG